MTFKERGNWFKPIMDYYEAKRKYENTLNNLFLVSYFTFYISLILFLLIQTGYLK